MFQDFKAEIKTFLIVVAVAVVFTVGGILLLKTMQPAPVVQTPPPAPSPQTQAEVLDTSDWQTYRSDEFGFKLKYPSRYSQHPTDRGLFVSQKDGDSSMDWDIGIVWDVLDIDKQSVYELEQLRDSEYVKVGSFEAIKLLHDNLLISRT